MQYTHSIHCIPFSLLYVVSEYLELSMKSLFKLQASKAMSLV